MKTPMTNRDIKNEVIQRAKNRGMLEFNITILQIRDSQDGIGVIYHDNYTKKPHETFIAGRKTYDETN